MGKGQSWSRLCLWRKVKALWEKSCWSDGTSLFRSWSKFQHSKDGFSAPSEVGDEGSIWYAYPLISALMELSHKNRTNADLLWILGIGTNAERRHDYISGAYNMNKLNSLCIIQLIIITPLIFHFFMRLIIQFWRTYDIHWNSRLLMKTFARSVGQSNTAATGFK